MLTIFNRKELITTMDMQRQFNIRSVLSANGIAYTVRTENLQGSSALAAAAAGAAAALASTRTIRMNIISMFTKTTMKML